MKITKIITIKVTEDADGASMSVSNNADMQSYEIIGALRAAIIGVETGISRLMKDE
jgi:hypothetical protein